MFSFEINDKECYAFGGGENVPCVLIGIAENDINTAKGLESLLNERLGNSGYFIVCYKVRDWFVDFSPWEYKMSSKDYFAGNGLQTLSFLENELVPHITEKYSCDKNRICLCGYSLAGLFSLWALYKSTIFCGCASCSGSLWFEGWDSFAKCHSLPENSVVYLSLGDKEEKTSHSVMSNVGRITREQDTLLENDKNVMLHTLVSNSGGHFNETTQRTAKGIEWLLNALM